MLDSELLMYKEDSNNRLSAVQVISGVVNNVWAHKSAAERTAGDIDWVKLFHKAANDADETLLDAIHRMDQGCTGDSWMLWAAAAQREDIVTDWPGSPPARYYTAVDIKTNVTAGTATVVIECKDAAQTVEFVNGDVIFLTDQSNPDAAGNTEQKLISGVPVISTLEVTITVDSVWANSYTTASGSRVANAPAAADVETSFDNVTDASGIYDDTTYPIILDNIGTIEETVTVTFSDATNFTVAGDTIGAMGAGTVAGDYTYTNTDFTKPAFTIDKDGWEGSPSAGNTFIFQTHPAAYAMGFKKVTPAGASSTASELHRQAITGESPT